MHSLQEFDHRLGGCPDRYIGEGIGNVDQSRCLALVGGYSQDPAHRSQALELPARCAQRIGAEPVAVKLVVDQVGARCQCYNLEFRDVTEQLKSDAPDTNTVSFRDDRTRGFTGYERNEEEAGGDSPGNPVGRRRVTGW